MHRTATKQLILSPCDSLSPSASWPWGLWLLTSPRCLESTSAHWSTSLPLHEYMDLTEGAWEASSQDGCGGTFRGALTPSVGQLPRQGSGRLGIWWPSGPPPGWRSITHVRDPFPVCSAPSPAALSPPPGVFALSLSAHTTAPQHSAGELAHKMEPACSARPPVCSRCCCHPLCSSQQSHPPLSWGFLALLVVLEAR